MTVGRKADLDYAVLFSTDEGREQARAELESAPQIHKRSEWFYIAFKELETERSTGENVGPIPFSAIMLYAKEFGLKQREKERFLNIMRALDYTSLKIYADQRKKAREKTDNTNKQDNSQTHSW